MNTPMIEHMKAIKTNYIFKSSFFCLRRDLIMCAEAKNSQSNSTMWIS